MQVQQMNCLAAFAARDKHVRRMQIAVINLGVVKARQQLAQHRRQPSPGRHGGTGQSVLTKLAQRGAMGNLFRNEPTTHCACRVNFFAETNGDRNWNPRLIKPIHGLPFPPRLRAQKAAFPAVLCPFDLECFYVEDWAIGASRRYAGDSSEAVFLYNFGMRRRRSALRVVADRGSKMVCHRVDDGPTYSPSFERSEGQRFYACAIRLAVQALTPSANGPGTLPEKTVPIVIVCILPLPPPKINLGTTAIPAPWPSERAPRQRGHP